MQVDPTPTLFRLGRRLCVPWLAAALAVAAPLVRADNLLTAWQGAQQRDSAFIVARQMLQVARQGQLRSGSAGAHERSDMQARLASERYRQAEQDLALRVANAYLDLLVTRHRAELALAHLNIQARQLRQAQLAAEAKSGAGAAEPQDARLRFDQARVQRITAVRELDQRRAELERIAGALPDDLQVLRRDFAVAPPEPADPAWWMGLAGQDHPRVRLQQAALELAGLEVERRREEAEPNLDMTARRARILKDGSPATSTTLSAPARSAQVGVVLTVPLDEGAGPGSRVREALAAQDRAQAELARARILVTGQASRALASALQGLARADAMAVALRTARPAAEAAQASLRAGARLPHEAALALQQFQLAEHEWFGLRVASLVDGLRLKAVAGNLDERDLAAVNALLVPAAAVQ
jgi:outer membrane protein